MAKKTLVKLGIGSNTVVMVKGDINPQTFALFIACMELRAIIVPCLDSNKKIIDEKIKISEVEKIVSGELCAKNDIKLKCDTLQSRKKAPNKFYKILKDKKAAGLVLFTSGTSGEPKAAVHNINNLFKKFLEKGKSLKTVGFLLYDHWGGLNTVFYSIFNGGCIVCLNTREPDNVCKLIEDTQAELLPVSPSFINLMLASKSYKKYNISSLQIISYGSEPMTLFSLKELKKLLPKVKLKQTYGLIEIGVLQTKSTKSDSLFLKIDSRELKYRIREGMLERTKTSEAMLGYLNAPQPFTSDGWFITGDEVELKGEELRIIGRKSEIINIGGKKVFPVEIETVLLQHDKVLDALVYSEENFLLGAIVCAKIYVHKTSSLKGLKNEIKKFCNKSLNSYQVPVKINFVTEPIFNDRLKKIQKKR